MPRRRTQLLLAVLIALFAHGTVLAESKTEKIEQLLSLYHAYGMTNGDRQPAIENYQRSLDLDPGNTNAVQKLRELRETEESEGSQVELAAPGRKFTIPEHDFSPRASPAIPCRATTSSVA